MTLSLLNLAIILGAIIFAYFSWRKIELGIYVIVFCLPFYLIRFSIYGIPSTALELAIYILFIIWLIRKSLTIKQSVIFPDKMFENGIVLLFAGVTLSTLFSSDLKASAGILKGWFLDPFLFYMILVLEISSYKQRENILKALYLSGLSVAILSLLYWFGFLLNGVSFDLRLHAFYLSPNYLAMFLSPALIIGIYFFIKRMFFAEPKERNIILLMDIVCLSVILLALYLTYSFAAWFAVTIAVIFLAYLVIPLKKRKAFFVFILLIVIVVFFSLNGTSKFENLKNLSYRSSYTSRLMIWRSAWEIGKDNFIAGIGPGNFQNYYLDYQARFSQPYLEWAVPQPHNIFLAFWLETGILGLAGFVVILSHFFNRSIRSIQSDLSEQENHILVIVLFSVMVYMVMHGLFDTTYWKNDLSVVFWLILALFYSIRK